LTTWFGLAGAFVALIGAAGYLKSILFGSTRPHRVSWGVWCLIALLGFFASESGGAGPALYVVGAFVAIMVVVFLLTLSPRYGKPGGEWYDPWLGVAAIVTLVVWRLLNLPAALAASVAVAADCFALWPTLRESWRQPETEATWPWVAGTLAFLLGVLAVENRNFAAMAYPAYLLGSNCLIAGALLIRSFPRFAVKTQQMA
jgi:hypothetical protein